VHVLGGGVPLSRLCRKPAIAIFQTCVTGESPVQSGTRQNNFNSRVTEKKLDLSQWRETVRVENSNAHTAHTPYSTTMVATTASTDPSSSSPKTTLRALGFCGADDSVHPNFLAILSNAYPLVEFGVLFRPDLEGQPRYASTKWVEQLSAVAARMGENNNNKMKLAAHLCGSRVNEVLDGKDDFLSQLDAWSFRRVQINATAVNGVDTSRLAECVPIVSALIKRHPQLEFILQKNEETRPLWEGILNDGLPTNVSMLVDESKGTGVTATSWPSPVDDYELGYAGGIGPHNIEKILQDVAEAGQGRAIWIDMESSLRSTKNGKDVFDLDKCYQVVEAACEMGFLSRPSFLA
jgi:phosphoribosylanthranilate isomerase